MRQSRRAHCINRLEREIEIVRGFCVMTGARIMLCRRLYLCTTGCYAHSHCPYNQLQEELNASNLTLRSSLIPSADVISPAPAAAGAGARG